MSTRNRLCWAATVAFALPAAAGAGQGHHHHHHNGSVVAGLGAVGGGYGLYLPFYTTIGFGGVPYTYVPLVQPVFGSLVAPLPAFGGGMPLAGPMPPPELVAPPQRAAAPVRPRRSDPARSAQLMTYGDRHFRAGDMPHAADRYAQALAADPSLAAPRVRLAQVAIQRGQYAEAANRIREAISTQPGWLFNPPDIQKIYGEPADFTRQIRKLETHLQAHPGDRDAWFVLGAQWYLSGQTRKAADVFLRLSDRKADPALTALLDAATPRAPAPK